MVKRRRIAWMAAAGLAMALGLAAWLWLSSSRSVRLANHRDIQAWMTLAEVEGVLGGPPGDYSSIPGQTPFRLNVKANSHAETWISDEGIVMVCFDAEGRTTGWSVVGPGVIGLRPIDRVRASCDRLRAWVGW